MKRILVVGATLLFGFSNAQLIDVTFQSKWFPQAQFAGYFVAQSQGFYEEEGLNVTVLDGGNVNPTVQVASGNADFGTLTEFDAGAKGPIYAIIAGVALAFFAMTGFENAANVAEETVNPSKTFPRALVGGMVAAGVIYVLVAMTAALVAARLVVAIPL